MPSAIASQDSWAEIRVASEVKAESKGMSNAIARQSVTGVTKTAAESVSASITRLCDVNQLRAAKALNTAIRTMEPLEIKSVGDLATGVKLLRVMDGRDKEGANISVQLGAFWSGPKADAEGAAVIDVAE